MKASVFKISKSIVNQEKFNKLCEGEYVSLEVVYPNLKPNEMQKVCFTEKNLFFSDLTDVLPIEIKNKHLNLNLSYTVSFDGEFYLFEPFEVSNARFFLHHHKIDIGNGKIKMTRKYVYRQFKEENLIVECICFSTTVIASMVKLPSYVEEIKEHYERVKSEIKDNVFVITVDVYGEAQKK